MSAWDEYKKTMIAPPSLWGAAKQDDVPQLEALLTGGAPLEALDARGYSPLMHAAYAGHARAVTFLLARGADPNSRDGAGNSVLMGASFKGHLALVEQLLDAGADPAATNDAGLSALAFARMFGRSDVAALLEARAPHVAEAPTRPAAPPAAVR